MKWLVLSGFFICFISYGQCGALKCTSEGGDSACRIEKEEKVTVPKKSDLKNGKDCAPDTHWKSQCNDCGCSPEGLAHCTEKGCLGYENEPIMQCAPDSMWNRECNTCWCTAEGRAMCTKMGCVGTAEPQFDDSEEVTADKRNSSPFQHLDFPDIKDKYKSHLEEGIRVKVKRSVCKPSQTFPSECNTCKCASDGLSYHCTQNECMEKTDVDKEVEVFMENEGVDHIERTSVCKPQGTFYVGCNTCHCNYHGTDYSCTNKPCPLPEDVEIFHELREMKPIIPYKDDKELKSSNKTKAIVCAANRMFIKNCNTCWCNENGTGYFCTRKVCVADLPELPEESPAEEDLRKIKRECNPDEVFELNCNTCRCNPEGTSYSCTRRACEDGAEGIVKASKITDKNKLMEKNTADTKIKGKISDEDILDGMKMSEKISDELMFAVMGPVNDKIGENISVNTKVVEIIPDEAMLAQKNFVDTKNAENISEQINVAGKSSDEMKVTETTPHVTKEADNNPFDIKVVLKGSDVIAEKALKDKNATISRKVRAFPSGPPRACQPGLEFRMDCNTCLCNNEGRDFSCTRINCAAASTAVAGTTTRRRKRDVMKEIESECAPGSVFEQGCMVCRCGTDGRHATCTQRHCDKQTDTENDVDASLDSGFRCSPGEQFKRACNDCTCSADGKSVFCTLRLCDSDIAPTT